MRRWGRLKFNQRLNQKMDPFFGIWDGNNPRGHGLGLSSSSFNFPVQVSTSGHNCVGGVVSSSAGSEIKNWIHFLKSGAKSTSGDLVRAYLVQLLVSLSNRVGGVGPRSPGCLINKWMHFLAQGSI